MRKLKMWMNAAILICGTTTMLSSCASESDNPAPVDPASVATDYSDEEHWLIQTKSTGFRYPKSPKTLMHSISTRRRTSNQASKRVLPIMHRLTIPR